MKLKYFIFGTITGILLISLIVAGFLYYGKSIQNKALNEMMESETVEIETDISEFKDWQEKSFKPITDSMVVKQPRQLIFVNYWATWCAPCLKEFPLFEELLKDSLINNNVRFIFVSNQPKDKVEEFVKNEKFKLPFYFQDSKKIDTTLYNHKSIPTNYIFDQKQKVVYKTSGSENWNSILNKKFIKSLLD
jgi:thiol-disulfide isomerase/thioredoxin